MNTQTADTPPTAGAAIRIQDARVRLGRTLVLDGLSLEIAAGECVALLGSSGSGKTTILRLLAGLVPAEHGSVYLDDREISRVSPEHRGMAMIHQRFLLFPHLTVNANVAFGLPYRGVPRGEQRERVDALLDLVGLHGLGERYPHELSGGQQQRVAIARAVATRPRVLLLDEPLNSLDQPIRERLLDELRTLHAAEGWTMLYVTHDQAEAARVAARVALLDGGKMLQVAPYETLREQPASRAAASVLGLRNIMPAEIVEGQLRVPSLNLTMPASGWNGPDGQILAYLPPDRLLLGPCPDGWITLSVRIEEIVSLPHAVVVHVLCGPTRLQAVLTRAMLAAHHAALGATVRLHIDPRSIHRMATDSTQGA